MGRSGTCLIAMPPSTPKGLGWVRKPGFNRGNTVLALGPEKCAWRIQMDRMNIQEDFYHYVISALVVFTSYQLVI